MVRTIRPSIALSSRRPQRLTAPAAMLLRVSGTATLASAPRSVPRPSHWAHQPRGWLKLSAFGSSGSNVRWQSGQEAFWLYVLSAPESGTTVSKPPERSSACSTESLSRVAEASRTVIRSTMISIRCLRRRSILTSAPRLKGSPSSRARLYPSRSARASTSRYSSPCFGSAGDSSITRRPENSSATREMICEDVCDVTGRPQSGQ